EEAASKAPWDVFLDATNQYLIGKRNKKLSGEFWSSADAYFCACARTDQPRLRIAYKALLAENERLREGLRESVVGDFFEDHKNNSCRMKLGQRTKDWCTCGIHEHNARIDALLGEGETKG
ncbi:hypothetical protein LCGC14_2449790, partial [marine sediment metagenome]